MMFVGLPLSLLISPLSLLADDNRDLMVVNPHRTNPISDF